MYLGIESLEKQIGLSETCSDSIFRKQYLPNVCWAACLEMLLRSHCLDISQDKIIDFFNRRTNDLRPCYPDCGYYLSRIAELLSNVIAYDVFGNKRIIRTEYHFGWPDCNLILNEIFNYNPIIINYRQKNINIGHANLLTNIGFTELKNGLLQINCLDLRDPDPRYMNLINKGRKVISCESFIDKIIDVIFIHVDDL